MKFWEWGSWKEAYQWCHREFAEFAGNFMRDMRSMRALWNYVYLGLYAFLCVWAALYYAHDSLNTAIMTTGGLVGTIFTAYVFSTTSEKMQAARLNIKRPDIDAPVPENEDGVSD